MIPKLISLTLLFPLSPPFRLVPSILYDACTSACPSCKATSGRIVSMFPPFEEKEQKRKGRSVGFRAFVSRRGVGSARGSTKNEARPANGPSSLARAVHSSPRWLLLWFTGPRRQQHAITHVPLLDWPCSHGKPALRYERPATLRKPSGHVVWFMPGSASPGTLPSLPRCADDQEKDTPFPVHDTVSSAGTARHPYFALDNGLQQPIEDGPLRYTDPRHLP
ncbi:hypothetical protein L249_8220 [Ophiocordyceps polyrhachis-furcata BCC 54312]|uniref:Secreted protein n=1 Tax=Ophiocordyceps polyrhachis-furcata BCC 54312 TaxID=1330021 RepID=A0A367LHJ8_9HYPO|nr:hypothetical protein L249_8220 [Ophiocordyceps polyrhachis-furcata BCC 54312]